MNSLLHRLPLELFNSIICAVDNKKDLKSLRLTCRALRDACTPRLYSDMYVSMEKFYAYDYDPKKEDDGDGSYILVDEYEYVQDRFTDFMYTHGHLVRSLEVDGAESYRSPLELVRFLEFMPNIQDVVMRGVYEIDADSELESESDDEVARCRFRDIRSKIFWLFLKASLQDASPVGLRPDRPLQRLRYLNLDFYVLLGSYDDRDRWPLDEFSAAFIIPSLQRLSLTYVYVADEDFKFYSGHQGKTDLKDLCIHSAVISSELLETILSFPRALSSLELHNIKPEYHPGNPEDQNRAISQQRASLEVLSIKDLAHPVYIDRSEFPELREAHGCHERSSAAV